MKKEQCEDCKFWFKFLTNHSEAGNHQPPYIRLCRSCHDLRDGMEHQKPRINKKYQRGTPKHKRK